MLQNYELLLQLISNRCKVMYIKSSTSIVKFIRFLYQFLFCFYFAIRYYSIALQRYTCSHGAWQVRDRTRKYLTDLSEII